MVCSIAFEPQADNTIVINRHAPAIRIAEKECFNIRFVICWSQSYALACERGSYPVKKDYQIVKNALLCSLLFYLPK
jgi:hypothetical protein